MPSTITTAPSIIIPKSTAPRDNKFADIFINLKQINANNKASGTTMETIRVVLQLNMNNDTIKVTSNIPSTRLCITVPVAK